MTFHVIIQDTSEDKFSVNADGDNKVLKIPSFYSDSEQLYVTHNIKRLLSANNLTPSDKMIDFGNLCLAAYTVDQLVSRAYYGHYQWSRYFKLYMPVEDLDKWKNAKTLIEECLSFLSGDKWEVYFRGREKVHEDYQRVQSEIQKVTLFSGGLDSFIGSVDLLEQGQNISLVSHHKMGGGSANELHLQEKLVESLVDRYPNKTLTPFYFFVQPNKKADTVLGNEITQRSRSILFIALGLLVANAIGEDTTLTIPENGLISLNAPLTKTRYGSYSTRTTHPNFLHKLGLVMAEVGIRNSLFNPYQYRTKGEMITESLNQNLVRTLAYETVSCSRPGNGRFIKREELHCGYCVPCLIRRASMYKAGIDSYSGNYIADAINTDDQPDTKAFKIALARYSSYPSKRIFEILKSGPLHCNNEDMEEFIGVYQRGMEEVQAFLNQE
jgi:hypothetical protein